VSVAPPTTILVGVGLADAEKIERALRPTGLSYVAERVETPRAVAEAASRASLIVLDGATVGRDEKTLRDLRRAHPDVPVVVLGNVPVRALDADLAASGADDYVPRGDDARLALALQRSLRWALEKRELRRTERELSAHIALLDAERDACPEGILVVDRDGRALSFNRRFAALWGIAPDALARASGEEQMALILEKVADRDAFLERLRYLYRHPDEESCEEIALADGRVFERYTGPIAFGDGDRRSSARVWFLRDVTERVRAERSVRDAELRFRMLFEGAPDAILLFDNERQRFVDANASAERLFECDRTRILRHGPQYFYALEQPDEVPVDRSFAEHTARALAGEEVAFARRILTARGTERYCDVRLSLLPAEAGCVIRASFVDVTERRRAERAAARLTRALTTLSAANGALVRAVSEDELLEAMCRVAVDSGYVLAWIGRAERDGAKTVKPIAWAGAASDYIASVDISWAPTERGHGPTGTAIRSRKPVVNARTETNPFMRPWRSEAEKRGFRSSIAVPLVVGEEVFGAFTLYAAEPDAFDDDETKMLVELADDLAYGIGVLRERAAR
jgi:PAS domain S-box-containing protein